MNTEKTILAELLRIIHLDKELELLNVYRGVPVLYKAAVARSGPDFLQLYVPSYEAACLLVEKQTNILNKSLEEPVTADAAEVDLAQGTARLVRFRYTASKLGERMTLRVEPREPIRVALESGGRTAAAEVVDLSLSGLGLRLAGGDLSALRLSSVVKLLLPLPTATLSLTGTVRYARGSRLGITFVQDTQTPSLLRYVHQRQSEILRELQALHRENSRVL